MSDARLCDWLNIPIDDESRIADACDVSRDESGWDSRTVAHELPGRHPTGYRNITAGVGDVDRYDARADGCDAPDIRFRSWHGDLAFTDVRPRIRWRRPCCAVPSRQPVFA